MYVLEIGFGSRGTLSLTRARMCGLIVLILRIGCIRQLGDGLAELSVGQARHVGGGVGRRRRGLLLWRVRHDFLGGLVECDRIGWTAVE